MKQFRQLFILFMGGAVILGVGTAGFAYFEGLRLFDALWLTVITILTVGYGDLVPVTKAGKIFALIIIPVGIVFFTYAAGTVLSRAIEGMVTQRARRFKMKLQIDQLRDHIIVCGYGRVGEQVVSLLEREQIPVVVVDRNPAVLEKMFEESLYVEGDATDDEILQKAGIERARGIVLALSSDANNVLLTLTAKGLNPRIQVVARAERVSSEEKLLRAGADKVINPSSIGGRRMAMSILKPNSVEYIDTILQSEREEIKMEEILIQPDSPLVGRPLGEMKIRRTYGVNIVGIKRGEKIISNPTGEVYFQPEDLLIVVGSAQQLSAFESMVQGRNTKDEKKLK